MYLQLLRIRCIIWWFLESGNQAVVFSGIQKQKEQEETTAMEVLELRHGKLMD